MTPKDEAIAELEAQKANFLRAIQKIQERIDYFKTMIVKPTE